VIGAGEITALLAAGVAAGICGAAAGLASLASYPALLAVGLSPVAANVTNSVALIGSSAGSVAGSRRELRGQRAHLVAYAPMTLLGGVTGCAVLLLTPAGGFERVVPLLVVAAAVLVWFRPAISRRLDERRAEGAGERPGHHWSARTTMFLLGAYGGYFGAGAGVMNMALLGIVTSDAIVRINALKNVVLGIANSVAALGFMVFGPVLWSAAVPLGVGCVIGGYLGPAIARAVPPTVLRAVITLAGLYLGIELGVSAYA